ncbi:MAG: hypothetical protein GY939_10835, partial [Actinomycetia bacterium]|nr:hypothetical protein [Actinomycetes bacterium]
MTNLVAPLLQEPTVAASGAAMLSDALRAQGITVADVAWRPPPTNLIEPLDRIAA